MKTLVTGGAGFIGAAIARALLARGDQVRVMDNFLSGLRSGVPDGAELVNADIRDLDAIREAVRDTEIVFHQAAFKSVPKSLDDPALAETCNALGTLNVLLASEEAGVRRLIYASSSSAYGDTSSAVKNEEMPTFPISPYGVSKLTGEHYCRVWTRLKRLPTVSLRYFNVFGPGQRADSEYSAIFPAFISRLSHGLPPQIYGDGEQSRDFTYIDDVVHANLLAAKAESAVDGTVINISAGSPKSVNQVAFSVSQAMGVDIQPIYLPARQGDIVHSTGDNERARAQLGWVPRADWGKSVQSTVNWFVANLPSQQSDGDKSTT